MCGSLSTTSWHLAGCKPDADDDRIAREPDGVSPIQRTLAAWRTTDLHVEVVTALFDAGLNVNRSKIGSLLSETCGTEIDMVLAQLLKRGAR